MSRAGGGGGGTEPRPAWEGVPGPQGGQAGGTGGAPRSLLRTGVEGWGRAGVLEVKGWGERGADRYVRLAQDASAASSLGGPGGGLVPDRKWGRDGVPGEWREEDLETGTLGPNRASQGAPCALDTGIEDGGTLRRREMLGVSITGDTAHPPPTY